jgi:hypothetical protein
LHRSVSLQSHGPRSRFAALNRTQLGAFIEAAWPLIKDNRSPARGRGLREASGAPAWFAWTAEPGLSDHDAAGLVL